jgi:hypothetical protein
MIPIYNHPTKILEVIQHWMLMSLVVKVIAMKRETM